jgi:hypothetical protein
MEMNFTILTNQNINHHLKSHILLKYIFVSKNWIIKNIYKKHDEITIDEAYDDIP